MSLEISVKFNYVNNRQKKLIDRQTDRQTDKKNRQTERIKVTHRLAQINETCKWTHRWMDGKILTAECKYINKQSGHK